MTLEDPNYEGIRQRPLLRGEQHNTEVAAYHLNQRMVKIPRVANHT